MNKQRYAIHRHAYMDVYVKSCGRSSILHYSNMKTQHWYRYLYTLQTPLPSMFAARLPIHPHPLKSKLTPALGIRIIHKNQDLLIASQIALSKN